MYTDFSVPNKTAIHKFCTNGTPCSSASMSHYISASVSVFIVLCIQQHAPQRSSHTSPSARPDGSDIFVTKNARTSCWQESTTPETNIHTLARCHGVPTPNAVSTSQAAGPMAKRLVRRHLARTNRRQGYALLRTGARHRLDARLVVCMRCPAR